MVRDATIPERRNRQSTGRNGTEVPADEAREKAAETRVWSPPPQGAGRPRANGNRELGRRGAEGENGCKL